MLFGKEKIQDGNVIDMAEHGRVGGLSTGQPFKFVSIIDGATPTIGNNPSISLTYDVNNQVTNIAMTIGATTYNKTLTWVGGVCTAISAWV